MGEELMPSLMYIPHTLYPGMLLDMLGSNGSTKSWIIYYSAHAPYW